MALTGKMPLLGFSQWNAAASSHQHLLALELSAVAPYWPDASAGVCATDTDNVRSAWATFWGLQPPHIIISRLWESFWLPLLARCLC